MLLKYRIFYEVHDTATGGHFGTAWCANVIGDSSFIIGWTHTHVWNVPVGRNLVHTVAAMSILPILTEFEKFISMGFSFDLPKDSQGNTSSVIFVGWLSKMYHLAVILGSIDNESTAQMFIDWVFDQNS